MKDYVDSALKKSTLKINSAHVLDMVKRYKIDETGATAIEYGLISSLIGALLITGASALGQSVNELFNGVSLAVEGVDGDAPPDIPRANSSLNSNVNG